MNSIKVLDFLEWIKTPVYLFQGQNVFPLLLNYMHTVCMYIACIKGMHTCTSYTVYMYIPVTVYMYQL